MIFVPLGKCLPTQTSMVDIFDSVILQRWLRDLFFIGIFVYVQIMKPHIYFHRKPTTCYVINPIRMELAILRIANLIYLRRIIDQYRNINWQFVCYSMINSIWCLRRAIHRCWRQTETKSCALLMWTIISSCMKNNINLIVWALAGKNWNLQVHYVH